MKRNYLLSIIVIGLIILSLYSTYAMFTTSVETNNIIIDSILCEGVSKKGQEFAMKATGGQILFNNNDIGTMMCYSKFDINNFLNKNKKSIF